MNITAGEPYMLNKENSAKLWLILIGLLRSNLMIQKHTHSRGIIYTNQNKPGPSLIRL